MKASSLSQKALNRRPINRPGSVAFADRDAETQTAGSICHHAAGTKKGRTHVKRFVVSRAHEHPEVIRFDDSKTSGETEPFLLLRGGHSGLIPRTP